MTLTRQATLRAAGDFSYVFEKAKKVYGDHLTLLFRPTDLGYPRLGLAVSKKHTRNAIVRNRVRRIAKESFRLTTENLGSVDIVILSKKGIAEVDAKILRQSIDKQWQVMIKKCAKS